MADYREISQTYAKGSITAMFTLNGGAAIALLTQVSELTKQGLADEVGDAMLYWAFGAAIAALTWVFAFISTRYVDKDAEEPGKNYIWWSNLFMYSGIGAVLLSWALFLAGAYVLSNSLPNATL